MSSSNTKWKSTMNLGLILGGILIILHLLFWFLKIEDNRFVGYLNVIAVILCIVRGTKTYREEELGGVITYSQALGYGTLIGFFSTIIWAFYFYLFITLIDPEFVDRSLLILEEAMLNSGYTEEQIEFFLSYQELLRNPVVWSVTSIFMYTIRGFIVSLITSIFIKKEGDPFNRTMSEINK